MGSMGTVTARLALAIAVGASGAGCSDEDDPVSAAGSTTSPSRASSPPTRSATPTATATSRPTAAAWVPLEPSGGRSLRILVAGDACAQFDRATVSDTGRSLKVLAYVKGGGSCPAALRGLEATVRLPRPLRDGEQVDGQCSAAGDDVRAQVCRSLRDLAPVGGPPDGSEPPPPAGG